MSYYGFYDAEIDYVICVNCKEESFAWVAEMFRCTSCGSSEFISPIGKDISKSSESTIGKRKRSRSGEDSMRE